MELTLQLIREDLCISTDSRDKYLMSQIRAAVSDMRMRGVIIDLSDEVHRNYIVDRVCWKFRNRANPAAVLPDFIRAQEANIKLRARVEKE